MTTGIRHKQTKPKRVSSAVRLRFWPDVAGPALLGRSWRRVSRGRVSGVV